MKIRSENYIINDDLVTENLGEGVSRQIMGYDDQLMMVKVIFEKGSIGYAHVHFHSQCTYVVSGTFEVMIKGDKKILHTGDGFYTEPDVQHGVVCLEEGVLLDTFSPVRLEFLE